MSDSVFITLVAAELIYRLAALFVGNSVVRSTGDRTALRDLEGLIRGLGDPSEAEPRKLRSRLARRCETGLGERPRRRWGGDRD